MKDKKVFILVPDGVGLRNFAYGDFCKQAEAQGFDVTFWNDTPFDLSQMGYKQIKISGSKLHPMTYVLKNVRLHIDLTRNIRKSDDTVYDSYRFPFQFHNIKQALRSIVTKTLIAVNSSEKGIEKVREKIIQNEKSTPFYQSCLETLQREKPDMVFCTNQRTAISIAPIEAAKTLGIPTATFIFSWDNLPKATMALETDYYIVWSEHMKNELLYYYEYITEDQIFVTGTPQFEPHTYKDNLQSRDEFFAEHGLDPDKKYLCFSGDDVTTSPNDQQYLEDTAKAIRDLNKLGNNYGLIFRRCPVDFSKRYDKALAKYADIIVPISPKWEKIGGGWNTILPTKADLDLQMNTIAHTEMVINVASSMVFDYVSFGKPCAYINYNVEHSVQKKWSIKNVYKFVHFRSMPTKEAVIWLNSADYISKDITRALSGKTNVIPEAGRWFEVINQHPVQDASKRILAAFEKIIARKK